MAVAVDHRLAGLIPPEEDGQSGNGGKRAARGCVDDGIEPCVDSSSEGADHRHDDEPPRRECAEGVGSRIGALSEKLGQAAREARRSDDRGVRGNADTRCKHCQADRSESSFSQDAGRNSHQANGCQPGRSEQG